MNEHRRQLLQAGAFGLTQWALQRAPCAGDDPDPSTVVRRRVPRATGCILLYMDGGPSHIDLFDLKPAAPAEIRGPYQPIATSVPGIGVCEHLPRLARQMHRILQIRSVRHTETVHDPAVYQMLTGYKHVSSAGGLKVEETDNPHLGCAFAMVDRAPTCMPRFIHTPDRMAMESRVLPGQNAGILPASFDPFPVEITHDGQIIKPSFTRFANETPARLAARLQLLRDFNYAPEMFDGQGAAQRLEQFRQQAFEIVCSPEAQRAFDLERESPETHDRYGRYRHGQCVLLARRLREAGCRFVTVYWGNEDQDWADGKGLRRANNPWDTHRNHFPICAQSLLPRADQTFAALLDDLAESGLLDETLVVWMGDFGRTPYISKPWASRDHWPHAFTVLLAGAGVRAGSIYGRTDKHAAEVEDDPVSPADLTATILDALGVSPATQVSTARGVVHRLSTGRVLHGLFS